MQNGSAHPILVVDALATGESRNFPYLGNVPTVHWTGGRPEVEAREIVSRAVREALRFKHNRALLQRWASTGETVVPSAPEALTLAWNAPAGSGEQRFLYPDPPLTKQELAVLKSLRPNATFLTPFSKVAQWKKPDNIQCIAVSTSVSNDKERLGLSRTHEEAIFDEIHGYFLLAGLQIAYGGALNFDISKGTNFTHRLFELVRAYSRIAADAGVTELRPILNLAPWPLRLMYGDEDMNLFGVVADYLEGAARPRTRFPRRTKSYFRPAASFPSCRNRPIGGLRGHAG